MGGGEDHASNESIKKSKTLGKLKTERRLFDGRKVWKKSNFKKRKSRRTRSYGGYDSFKQAQMEQRLKKTWNQNILSGRNSKERNMHKEAICDIRTNTNSKSREHFMKTRRSPNIFEILTSNLGEA